MIKLLFLLFNIVFFLYSCTSVQDAFTLQKKNNSDEFLVEKKNPLTMPPKFGDLPEPATKNSVEFENKESGVSEVEKLITKDDSFTKGDQNNKSSIEKSILEKIQ